MAPADIARKLTKAQKACFYEIAEAGPQGLGFGKAPLFMRRRLMDMGLTERLPFRQFAAVREVLTPLGLAVRAELMKEEG